MTRQAPAYFGAAYFSSSASMPAIFFAETLAGSIVSSFSQASAMDFANSNPNNACAHGDDLRIVRERRTLG